MEQNICRCDLNEYTHFPLLVSREAYVMCSLSEGWKESTFPCTAGSTASDDALTSKMNLVPEGRT